QNQQLGRLVSDNETLKRGNQNKANQLRSLGKELAATTQELDNARRRLGLIRGAEVQLATLSRDDGSRAKIFMDPAGRQWLVYAHQLPDPGPDKDYQLWFVPKEGQSGPIPAGLLQVKGGVLEAQVEVPGEVPEIGQAAISLEPKGGSKTPTDVQMIGPI
ncbi:MAG: anti-sigma factor, partial [Deltaproteobacteria bacterium]|nr:anti-sigma factor [Deltaproteobacteria bacterium]